MARTYYFTLNGEPFSENAETGDEYGTDFFIMIMGQTLGGGRLRQAFRQVELVRGRQSKEGAKCHRPQGSFNLRTFRQQRGIPERWQELLHCLHSDFGHRDGQVNHTAKSSVAIHENKPSAMPLHGVVYYRNFRPGNKQTQIQNLLRLFRFQ